jgi:hypothetical protein
MGAQLLRTLSKRPKSIETSPGNAKLIDLVDHNLDTSVYLCTKAKEEQSDPTIGCELIKTLWQ